MKLWDHQQKAIEMAKGHRSLGLFFEMGTGKSATMVKIIDDKCEANAFRILGTLIFAPIVTHRQWREEFAKFHSKVPQHRIFIVYDKGTKRLAEIKRILEETKGECVIITNYQTVLMQKCLVELLNWRPKILVCDESHRCKSPTGKMTKAVTLIADRAQYKFLLTGTPMTNSPMDIFSQFRILDGGQTFGHNHFHFRRQYFEDKNDSWKGKHNYFPKWEPKIEMLPQINELIYKKAIRAVKSECLDLPPLMRKEIHVDLGKEQRRMYEEMKKDFITYVDDSACVAEIALTKALRLQQIVSGHIKTEDGKVTRLADNPRLVALKELLEDLVIGEKVIIWANFKEDHEQIRAICDELDIKAARLTGSIRDKDTEINNFRGQSDYRVLIAHPAAGGVGVNLVEASTAVYFSKGFSLEHDLQSEARNYRGGSEVHTKITRIDLIAKNTIDEIIHKALLNKQNLVNNILEIKKQLALSIG